MLMVMKQCCINVYSVTVETVLCKCRHSVNIKTMVFESRSNVNNEIRTPHAGANARLQLLLENSMLKRGITTSKNFEDYLPYWYGFPFC